MRLGAYTARLRPNSKAAQAYNAYKERWAALMQRLLAPIWSVQTGRPQATTSVSSGVRRSPTTRAPTFEGRPRDDEPPSHPFRAQVTGMHRAT